MKKRDFLAGMCCGAFIARMSGLDLSKVFQIIVVAVVVLALNFLWESIKNAVTKNTGRKIALQRLPKYS
jgi:hypothetical protein